MSQREIIDALEEELRATSKPVNFAVERVEAQNATWKVTLQDSSEALDERFEDASARWHGNPPSTAQVLAVAPETRQIYLRYLKGIPPARDEKIKIYPPRYLEKLIEIWNDPNRSAAALKFEGELRTIQPLSPEMISVPSFPLLRKAQKQAFCLLQQSVGFLWGPPGTGKTYTLGAMLAHLMTTNPSSRVLLLSSTNKAVDLALKSVDERLQELEKAHPSVAATRRRMKRYGNHFNASLYAGREHLLPVDDKDLITQIAELETKRPENPEHLASWKDKLEALRSRIPKPPLDARLLAMTTTAAAFSYDHLIMRGRFSFVVFDEASQVSLPYALALAPLGVKVIFSGDHKQLAPIVVSDHPSAKKYLSESPFKYRDRQACCTLDEQNRMVEEICDVVSGVFYDGQLRVLEGASTDQIWLSKRRVTNLPYIGRARTHIEPCTEEGKFLKTQYGNGPQRFESAQKAVDLAITCANDIGDERVVILTPYRAQRSLIRENLRRKGKRNIEVSTVHRAQGSECHTVIFDPVCAETVTEDGILLSHEEEGARLLNVAVSRAQARFVLLLSPGDRKNRHLAKIARAIEGAGKADAATPLADILFSPGFPGRAIGMVVRHGEIIGPIEKHPKNGYFAIGDSVTGESRAFNTAWLRSNLRPTSNA